MILILLTILKIIGIIFLVLLGLIILLLCLILFAPVKYRAKGAKHPDDMSANVSVSYLWPLVRAGVEYPSDTVLSVKILWMDLLHPKEKKSRKKKKSGGRRKQKKPEKTKQSDEPEQSDNTVKPMRAVPEIPVYQTYMSEQTRDAKTEPDQSGKKRNADKRTDQSVHKKAEKKSGAKKNSAQHTEKEAENKLTAIVTLILQYREMYPDVLGRVFHALGSILPRKCHIHLIFGTGSPDNTGYLYGAYCALYEYLPGTIDFEPVWMESYLDVEFELSGKIRLIHFVTAAVKIIADKRVRKFISEIRRL